MNNLLNGIALALQLIVALGIIVGFFTDFQAFLTVCIIGGVFFLVVWFNKDKE